MQRVALLPLLFALCGVNVMHVVYVDEMRNVYHLDAMAIFCVVSTLNSPTVIAAAQKAYPNDFLRLTQDACLVADRGTAMDVSRNLNLDREDGSVGSAVITSVGSYYGRADPQIWEWMRSRFIG